MVSIGRYVIRLGVFLGSLSIPVPSHDVLSTLGVALSVLWAVLIVVGAVHLASIYR